MRLDEIARQLDAHLKRILKENPDCNWLSDPCAWTNRRWVHVQYRPGEVAFLNKDESLGYLNWLDAGGAGKHFWYLMSKTP
jgi:hypothetical protein